MALVLRAVSAEDVGTFFENVQDKDQQWQAAFVHEDPSDREHHDKHWAKILNDPNIINRTIVVDDVVVGNIGRWIMDGIPQLTYWINKAHVGKG